MLEERGLRVERGCRAQQGGSKEGSRNDGSVDGWLDGWMGGWMGGCRGGGVCCIDPSKAFLSLYRVNCCLMRVSRVTTLDDLPLWKNDFGEREKEGTSRNRCLRETYAKKR